jgi:hypothetical protein
MKIRSLAILVTVSNLMGCGGDNRDPAIGKSDMITIMTAISDQPVSERYPKSEIGSTYDEKESWKVELRPQGEKSPSTWIRVDKATKKVEVVE